jgi:hypothetical protein
MAGQQIFEMIDQVYATGNPISPESSTRRPGWQGSPLASRPPKGDGLPDRPRSAHR